MPHKIYTYNKPRDRQVRSTSGLELEYYYVRNVSLLMDLKIFFMTIINVFMHSNVVEGVVDEEKETFLDPADGPCRGVLHICSPSISCGRLGNDVFFELTEIDGEQYHNPGKVSDEKYVDDLLKQNSMVYQGWKVYRWVYKQLRDTPDRVKDELATFLSKTTFRNYLSFLPEQKAFVRICVLTSLTLPFSKCR